MIVKLLRARSKRRYDRERKAVSITPRANIAAVRAQVLSDFTGSMDATLLINQKRIVAATAITKNRCLRTASWIIRKKPVLLRYRPMITGSATNGTMEARPKTTIGTAHPMLTLATSVQRLFPFSRSAVKGTFSDIGTGSTRFVTIRSADTRRACHSHSWS